MILLFLSKLLMQIDFNHPFFLSIALLLIHELSIFDEILEVLSVTLFQIWFDQMIETKYKCMNYDEFTSKIKPFCVLMRCKVFYKNLYTLQVLRLEQSRVQHLDPPHVPIVGGDFPISFIADAMRRFIGMEPVGVIFVARNSRKSTA